MILASAQTSPKRGDIQENLRDHYRLIKLAAEEGAELIAFPEMSITGYEHDKADSLAFSENDPRLDKLRNLAVDHKIIIIAGAPIKIADELFIGTFNLYPNHSVSIYTKQFLHPGEEVFFQSSFDHNPMIKLEDEMVSLAICADIDHPLHPENAKKAGGTIYIASIFFSPNGISNAHDSLSSYAKEHSMNVLMSNFSGESWGNPAGGRSAFWNNNGSLIAEMDDSSTGLLIVENNNDIWTGKILNEK
jgi:predicted amidohydrolase